MSLPRLLLVPQLTQIEWQIKPELERWAEVASFDTPGVGNEPAPESYEREVIVERGLLELDRLEWDRCVVVGDEFGTATAVRIALARREAVAGLALGHASLTYDSHGERPATIEKTTAVLNRLLEVDYAAFIRAISQATQGAYDDELADRFRERMPVEVVRAYMAASAPEPIGELLEQLDMPLLLGEHSGCLRFTHEGFEDAVRAFAQAKTGSYKLKPSVNPEFAESLHEFCAELDT